ncbi:MAG: fatty acid metabolism transcriptional regulator FadR [Anaerolineae bacterium]
MTDWTAPQRPADYAEETLVTAMVEGTYPPGSTLPGERELATQMGITRPTLREALQRLARDGWITIQHGKATVVNDFWQEGGLNVLDTLVRFNQTLPPNFVLNLLEVRLTMAPAYTRDAVNHHPERVIAHLEDQGDLEDTPQAYAAFDWQLHRILTIASANPIYPLILNGFEAFYAKMACRYFISPDARHASRRFYRALLDAFQKGDSEAAESITREMMERSCDLWRQAERETRSEGF